MTVKKRASRRTLKSDLSRVDAHVIQPNEYQELPKLTNEMLVRAKVKKGGRPVFEAAKADLTSAARGCYRTLEGDRPGLAYPYG